MSERRTVAERVVTAAVAGVVALGAAAAITQHIWQHQVTAGGTATTVSADPTDPPPPAGVWYDL